MTIDFLSFLKDGFRFLILSINFIDEYDYSDVNTNSKPVFRFEMQTCIMTYPTSRSMFG